MKIVFAAAALALMLSICNLCNLSPKLKDTRETNSNSMAMPTPTTTPPPAKASLKDAFPQTVGDFTLQGTYGRSDLKGDDKLLPGAEEVMGAVYKSSANKKEQVMVGKYASSDDAEAARKKRVPSSQYTARWTKGELLFVASDNSFKNNL